MLSCDKNMLYVRREKCSRPNGADNGLQRVCSFIFNCQELKGRIKAVVLDDIYLNFMEVNNVTLDHRCVYVFELTKALGISS